LDQLCRLISKKKLTTNVMVEVDFITIHKLLRVICLMNCKTNSSHETDSYLFDFMCCLKKLDMEISHNLEKLSYFVS
jgi:hypothetical protein